MIEAHTLDAWTRAADRATTRLPRRDGARRLRGAAVPLARRASPSCCRRRAARGAHRHAGARRSDAICRRGLEIFILAFLFRLQAFVVTPGRSPGDALPRRHPEHHGPGDRRRPASSVGRGAHGAGARRLVCAAAATAIAMVTPIVRATPAGRRAADRGCSGTCGRRRTTRRSRCFRGPASCSPAAPSASLLAPATGERAQNGGCTSASRAAGAALIALGFYAGGAAVDLRASRRSGPVRRRGSRSASAC